MLAALCAPAELAKGWRLAELERATRVADVWLLAHGQCVERFGNGAQVR